MIYSTSGFFDLAELRAIVQQTASLPDEAIVELTVDRDDKITIVWDEA